jgi:hypothetical protein
VLAGTAYRSKQRAHSRRCESMYSELPYGMLIPDAHGTIVRWGLTARRA